MSGRFIWILERTNIVEIEAASAQALHLDQAGARHHRQRAMLPIHPLAARPGLFECGRHQQQIEAQQISGFRVGLRKPMNLHDILPNNHLPSIQSVAQASRDVPRSGELLSRQQQIYVERGPRSGVNRDRETSAHGEIHVGLVEGGDQGAKFIEQIQQDAEA